MNYRRVFVQNSYVHIIIVAYKRKNIFINNIELLRLAFKNAKRFFNFEIAAICILPDHIHVILNPEKIKEYPKIISSIKYYFSKNCNVVGEVPTYGYQNKGEKGIFQHRFFEHTILSENELNNQIDYVHYNPLKHGLVKYVKDWKFSSFHNFVKKKLYEKDWGSRKDIKNFMDLDFE